MKSTFKIGRIKYQGEEVVQASTQIVDGEMKFVSDKTPVYVELNDIEVCYEDFTAGDVVTIAKEVGTQVFHAVKEGVKMQREQAAIDRQIRKEEEAERREMERRARQSRNDKNKRQIEKFSKDLSKEIASRMF